MANEQNLIPGGHKLTDEEASKGGKKSGETRRAKANMRRSVEMLLNQDVTTKNGETITGMDAVAMNMFKVAIDQKNRNNVYAARCLLEILGQNVSPLEIRKQKAEIKMIEAQVKQIQSGNENTYSKLDEILTELGNNAIQQEAE